jgi:hypothetical protein
MWPEINDTLRTGLAGIQALSTLRHTATTPAEAEVAGDALVIPGASTEIPCESGPQVVHGRGNVVEYLLQQAEERCPIPPQLLVGAGGMGKSTIARLVATKFRDRDSRRLVWWISAADEDRLSAALVSVARDLGASTADQEAIRSHVVARLGGVIDQVWRLLERSSSQWMLVIDNADDPGLLGPSDGRGWVRSSRNGLLLITTRNSDETCWPEAGVIPIRPLPIEAAADVLTDLAPHAGDRKAAAALAERLGCLPLALRMAGMYLRQDFVSWRTFDDYRRALDSEGTVQVLDASGRPDRGLVMTQTWELSLDALASWDLPQGRPLLWLLSCYAPGSPVPEEIITATDPAGDVPHPLAALLASEGRVPARQWAEYCRGILRALGKVSLIQRSDTTDRRVAIELHPFIAEVTRAVMDSSDPDQTGINPQTVRECAIGAVQTAIGQLDPGNAEHWPHFRALTPHVIELLTNAAPLLSMRFRRTLLNCMVRCVASYMWSRAESRAQQLAADTLVLASGLGAEREPVYQRLRHVYAWSLREQGRLAEAETIFLQILARQMRLPGGAMRGDTLRTRHDLAWTIGRQDRWPDAEEQFRDILRLRRERRKQRGEPGDDPDILHTRCMMCWSIGKQGRWSEAERNYRLLAADRAKIIGSHHADTLDTRENIGKTLAWQQNWAAAELEWSQLAALRAATLGEKNPDTLRTRQLAAYAADLLARATGERGGRRAAATLLRQVLDAQVDVRGEDHKETRETRALLAVLEGKPCRGLQWPEDLPQPAG